MAVNPQIKNLDLRPPKAPNLPIAPVEYRQLYLDQMNNALRLYFNQIDNVLAELAQTMSGTITDPTYVTFPPTNVDAFNRLVVASPYTLFDSQNRFAADNQFDTSTATGGSTTYLPNESTVQLSVTTSNGSEVVRQSYRTMPYQPGKGLGLLATFTMNAGKTGLRQRVGYFNTQNGVFFQQDDTTLAFVLRSYTSGAAVDTTITQANWNGDKLDGTGLSGRTIDVTKTQILAIDFEWLGVGDVRCGFFIDGQFVVCHTIHNDNVRTTVYMTTAILPVRYEIRNTAGTASSSSMKQICSTVYSSGGYEQTSVEHVATMTSATTGSYITTTFKPLVSIRLASTALGAVVIPYNVNFLPTTTDNYQVGLFKNGTLTGASYSAVASDANVEFDIAATAITGGTLVYAEFLTSRSGRSALSGANASFNFDLQLGSSLAGVSDIYTLAARTITGTGGGIGALSFYDLTQ
jgi:hypothetical protein